MSAINAAFTSLLRSIQTHRSSPWIRMMLQTLALSQAIIPAGWPQNYRLRDGDTFDFIVIGAGSGGATVAARLSEIPQWRVLLIEAGGDPPPASVIPSLFPTLFRTDADWDHQAQLNENLGQAHPNRVIFLSQGKMLGGSSSINYEIYARGFPQDYDDWNKVAPGWNWNNVLNYFMKSESMTDKKVLRANRKLHNADGPLKISRPKGNKYFNDVSNTILNSYEEMGLKRVSDINNLEVQAASIPHFTFANGVRSSTAKAYLLPNKERKNLHVAKFTEVIKILIDPQTNRTIGVKVQIKNKTMLNIYAKKEVILSAGSINTPKLLLLSGIGPKKEISKFGIETLADLPVGKNLHDHIYVPIVFRGKQGLDTSYQNVLILTELNEIPAPVQIGYFKLDHNINKRQQPQFQIFNAHVGASAAPALFYGCVEIYNYDNEFCSSLSSPNTFHEIDLTYMVLLHPKSRGEVKLRNKDPNSEPFIDLGYYRDEQDVQDMVDGVKFMMRYANTSYYRKVGGKIARLNVKGCKGITWGSDEYWTCYVKNSVNTLYHPVGTCAMGPNGVVDEKLKVHGIQALRIVDASVIPVIPSCNTNAPTIMIGEKAADIIKSEYGYL